MMNRLFYVFAAVVCNNVDSFQTRPIFGASRRQQRQPQSRLFGTYSIPNSDRTVVVAAGLEEMEDIVEDFAMKGREESGYMVIDVRDADEMMMTGLMSQSIYCLPLYWIEQRGALEFDNEEFYERFGFDKPNPEETIVFTCAAGVQAEKAARVAARQGYKKLVYYTGGAVEWFDADKVVAQERSEDEDIFEEVDHEEVMANRKDHYKKEALKELMGGAEE
eukprot:CAMPEP_0116842422 /NCGR_PEP_ID=MMETSP0418-20121206/11507_1 /TAXON_ID=1158023 /ORGANISM="Astrosyne radiata, Strain 13vi08-1A" /LENGTH=219 /DNA_ID=CAMNT_0004473029 /DNA_START=52 /DNA_END=711 /DNA_ORIENTATION=+